ncbi:MAG TPA: DMT family transporter [Pyrinomonadaceae bacterium]|nr:DMT family transporter [Pyrinomonadaceae bacterium]
MSAVVSERRAGGVGPHLALLSVQLMFGTWPIIGKIALRVLPSSGLVALRITGAAIAFSLIHFFTRGTRIKRRSDYARLALYSLLGVVLNQFLFTRGLALSTVINATLLGTAIPIFTLVFSALLGFERATLRSAFGTLVAAAGVVYLIDPLRADFSGDKTLGNLLLVANAMCYGAYIAISQDLIKRYGALTVITWLFVFGCIPAIPFGGYYLAQAPVETFGWMLWLVVAYIIIVPTVGAYYLNAWALARVPPSTVAVYINLQTLIAFALAPLVLGADEQATWRTLIAALLIFAGVAVVTWRTRSRAVEEVSERPDAIGH